MHLLHRARTATWLLFLLNGVLYACWAAHIPQLTARFHLDHQTLGLVLLTVTLGSLCTIRFTPVLLRRTNTGAVSLLGMCVMSVGLVLTAVVPTLPLLLLSTLLVGGGFAITDLCMNRAGASLERDLDTPIMSGLHGAFSIGMMVGAGLSSLLIGHSVHLLTSYLGICLITLVGAAATLPLHQRREATAVPEQPDPEQTQRGGGYAVLLVLGLSAAIIEGIANDWSSLYMNEVLESSAQVAPLALATFGLTMTLGRLTGDLLTRVLGPVRLGVFSSLMTTLGVGLLLGRGSEAVGLIGFALIGLGLSVLAPLAFSAAGRHINPKALPTLTIMFYSGFLFGPAFMGMLSKAAGLHVAFFLPLVLAVLSTVLWSNYRFLPKSAVVAETT